MRRLLHLALAATFACDSGREPNASLLSSSGGEVALADGNSFEFAITSENFKRWDSARRGIGKRVAARFGSLLKPSAPTERSINQAVAYLDGQLEAKQAIERAGMSVRDFVVMTVALEQEMRLASSRGEDRPPAPVDTSYDFPTIDTTFIAPQPLPSPTPDTLSTSTAPIVPTVDTQFTRPLPPTVFRRDTARYRDTLAARVAPIKRDSVPARDTTRTKPVPRDTVRDTTTAKPVPRDTVRDTTRISALTPGQFLRA